MGSWYATCGLSGLPITTGVPAGLILLTQGRGDRTIQPAAGTHTPTDIWMPLLWPIKGVYEDYGQLDKVVVPAQAFLAATGFLRERALKAYDPANVALESSKAEAKQDGIDGDFLRGITEGAVLYNSKGGKRFYEGELNHRNLSGRREPLGHTLVRQDVWNVFLGTRVDVWNDTSTVSEARRAVDDYISKAVEWFKDLDPTDNMAWMRATMKFRSHIEFEEYNSYIDSVSRHYYGFYHTVCEALQAGTDVALLRDAGRELADLTHVNIVMRQLRKAWAPPSGCGSQNSEYALYVEYYTTLADIALKAAKEYEE